MRKIKRLHILLEWLMVICMISMGYSAWAIVVPTSDNATLTMQSYPVIKTDEYVTIGDVTLFDYCDDGFLTSTDKTSVATSNVGTVKIPLVFSTNCYTNGSPFVASKGKIRIEIKVLFKDAEGNIDDSIWEHCELSAEFIGGYPNTIQGLNNNLGWASSTSSPEISRNFTLIMGQEEAKTVTLNLYFTMDNDFDYSQLDNKVIAFQTIVKDSHTS